MIKATQIRAARAMLEWSQKDLADKVGITTPTLKNIEKGIASKVETLMKIQNVFEGAGLQFGENNSISERSGEVSTFKGRSGFLHFIMDVYETVKKGGEIFVNNVDEEDFLKWEGDEAEAHMARMASVSNLRMKILIKEGDINTVSSYAKYKHLPSDRFGDIPTYIYGDKTAMIIFEEDDVEVFVIQHPSIARYFRGRFLTMWKEATE